MVLHMLNGDSFSFALITLRRSSSLHERRDAKHSRYHYGVQFHKYRGCGFERVLCLRFEWYSFSRAALNYKRLCVLDLNCIALLLLFKFAASSPLPPTIITSDTLNNPTTNSHLPVHRRDETKYSCNTPLWSINPPITLNDCTGLLDIMQIQTSPGFEKQQTFVENKMRPGLSKPKVPHAPPFIWRNGRTGCTIKLGSQSEGRAATFR